MKKVVNCIQNHFHTIDLPLFFDPPISEYRLRLQIIKKIETRNFCNEQKVGLLLEEVSPLEIMAILTPLKC